MITLYTTHCPKCSVLQKKLDAAKIDFNVCEDVDTMIAKGMLSAPYLEVDGEMMDYNTAISWCMTHENN